MTTQEARDSLWQDYQNRSSNGVPYPTFIMGMKVVTGYVSEGFPTEDVIRIDLTAKGTMYKPPESVVGVGWEGCRVVTYRGQTMKADSGDIA